jgi:uncharacterized protein (DUF1330 family)
MKRFVAMGIALLVGAGIGAAAVQTLHAQGSAPTYVVVAIRKVNDAAAYKSEVVDKAGAAVKSGGGRYVVRTDKITSFDGTPPQRFILLSFDSTEKAQAWHDSQATKEIDAARQKTTDSLSFMVEGLE